MQTAAFLLLLIGAGDWEMAAPGEPSDWAMQPLPAAVSPMAVSPRYPVHAQRWDIAGVWAPSTADVLAHLKGGEHAGKWDHAWLGKLSRAELLSLHDDDHEHRVQWAHVRKPAAAPAPAAVPQYIPRAAPVQVQKTRGGLLKRFARPGGSCPGGVCPAR